MKEKVYEFLMKIPKGKVVTYGQVGELFGSKRLARVVGNMLHSNPDGERYPCYKVVNKNGQLSHAYAFGGIEKQKEKLEAEGIEVIDYKVDLKKYQYVENNKVDNNKLCF